MEEKICPQCKTTNPIVANFCRHCGCGFVHNGVAKKKSNEAILQEEIYKLQRVCDKLHQEEKRLKNEVHSIQVKSEEIMREINDVNAELVFYKNALNNEKAINLSLNKEISSLKQQLTSLNQAGSTPPPHTKSSGGATYTPSSFPGIDFIPRTLFSPHFNIILWLFLTLINVGVFFLLQFFSDEVEHEFGEAITIFFKILVLLIYVRLLFKLCTSIIQALIFNHSADFVEKTPMTGISGKMYRIGKNSKLGLFDSKRKKVSVKTRYESIEVFDSNHLLLKASGKVGLYSIPKKKIIIPVKYNRIDTFKNHLADAVWSGGVDHYDMTGNLMR